MPDDETVVLRRYLQHALDQVLVYVAAASATLWGAAAAYGLVRLGAPWQVLFLPLVMLVLVSVLGTLWVEVWVCRTGRATPRPPCAGWACGSCGSTAGGRAGGITWCGGCCSWWTVCSWACWAPR